MQALVQETVHQFGKITILVNNAGIGVRDPGGASVCPVEKYDKVFNTNVRGLIQLTQLCIPHLKASKPSSIVNVSSFLGQHTAPDAVYYCMSKAAVDHYTRCLALELAPHGVRVNAVNPAIIRTDIFFTEDMGSEKEDFPEFEKAVSKEYPIGRIGEAEEVAKAIWFLASQDSSFVSGQTLKICGALSVTSPLSLPEQPSE